MRMEPLTLPVVWSCIRLIERKMVVLPQPDGPSKAVIWFFGKSRLTSLTATCFGFSTLPYRTVTCSSVMAICEASSSVQRDWAEEIAMPPAKGRSPEEDASQTTVTLKQMAAELADGHNLSKRQADALLDDLMTLAIHHIKNGHRVRLTGLGVIQFQ